MRTVETEHSPQGNKLESKLSLRLVILCKRTFRLTRSAVVLSRRAVSISLNVSFFAVLLLHEIGLLMKLRRS